MNLIPFPSRSKAQDRRLENWINVRIQGPTDDLDISLWRTEDDCGRKVLWEFSFSTQSCLFPNLFDLNFPRIRSEHMFDRFHCRSDITSKNHHPLLSPESKNFNLKYWKMNLVVLEIWCFLKLEFVLIKRCSMANVRFNVRNVKNRPNAVRLSCPDWTTSDSQVHQNRKLDWLQMNWVRYVR